MAGNPYFDDSDETSEDEWSRENEKTQDSPPEPSPTPAPNPAQTPPQAQENAPTPAQTSPKPLPGAPKPLPGAGTKKPLPGAPKPLPGVKQPPKSPSRPGVSKPPVSKPPVSKPIIVPKVELEEPLAKEEEAAGGVVGRADPMHNVRKRKPIAHEIQIEDDEEDDIPFDPSLNVSKKSSRVLDLDDEDEDYEEKAPSKKRGRFSRSESKPKKETNKNSKKKNGWGSKGKSSGDKEKKGSKGAGGRWKVLLFRYGTWFVVLLVMLLGLKQLIAPNTITAGDVADEVALSIGLNGFPADQGEALALRFVTVYMSKDANDAQRSDALSKMFPPGSTNTTNFAFSNDGGTAQRIVGGPFLAKKPTFVDSDGAPLAGKCDLTVGPCRALYTFTLSTVNPAKPAKDPQSGNPILPDWTAVAVPVLASKDASGAITVAIADLPAFVPATGISQEGAPLSVTEDKEAGDSLTAQLPGFFTAWGASDEEGIKRFLTTDPQPELLAGLGGTATYVSIADTVVGEASSSADTEGDRLANVTVTWKTATGSWTQQYRLTVFQDTDQKWYIKDIQGGGYGVTGNDSSSVVASPSSSS